jgi:hypothetical protein
MSRIFGNVRQIGYVTPDLQRSMQFMIDKAGIGPWFLAERLTIRDCAYRGVTSDLELSIAVANSGSLQIELIEPVGGQPSIYTEWLRQHPLGELPHHYSSWSDRYDDVCLSAATLGFETLLEGRSSFGPLRYFRHPDHAGFLYEVTEFTPPRRRMFAEIEQAAVGWDGSDPVRPWPSPHA